MIAKCLACSAGVSEETYCGGPSGYPSTPKSHSKIQVFSDPTLGSLSADSVRMSLKCPIKIGMRASQPFPNRN